MNNNYFNPYMFGQTAPFRMTPSFNAPRGLFSLFNRTPKGVGSVMGAKMGSKITFSSILNGTSKTLGVINQAIPVFYQVKPIWNNAKTMIKVAKQLNQNTVSNSNKNVKSNDINSAQKSQIKKESNSNSPTFFI